MTTERRRDGRAAPSLDPETERRHVAWIDGARCGIPPVMMADTIDGSGVGSAWRFSVAPMMDGTNRARFS